MELHNSKAFTNYAKHVYHLHQNSSIDNCNLSFQEITTQEKPKDPCLVVKRFNDIFIQYGPLESSLRLD